MKKILFSIWEIFALFLVLRILPYFQNRVPLGYDAGIYLYLLNVFPGVPSWQMVGFSPGLFTFAYPLIKLGVNSEFLLIPMSIFSQIFLFFAIFFVSKKLMGNKIALLTAFLFSVSLVQFRTFWFFYVKNTFALGFFLIALYFLTRKKVLLSVVLAVLLALFHLPTFLVYFLSLLVLMFWDKKDFKFYLKVLLLTVLVSGVYYLPTFDKTILPYLVPILKTVAPYKLITTGGLATGGGTFYSLPISFLMTIFYLPLAFIGFYISRRNESLKPFLVCFGVIFLMVITQFFFSRRFFIPLDLFLIFFGGIGLNMLLEKYEKQKDVLSFYFAILILFIFAFILKTGQPLIEANGLREIKDFNGIKNGYVLSTSKEDNAWLLGYTRLKLIAWDFGGEDKYWSSNQWEEFFKHISVGKKINLLEKLPKPLYIFINDKQLPYFKDIANFPCVKKLTAHFYQYNCNAKIPLRRNN